MKKINPVIVIFFVFFIMIILWVFPVSYVLSDKYTITQYRNDLKDLFLIFYVPLTLWLVLINKKMSEIALNAQKAANRPELECTLLIGNEKPNKETLKAKNHLEILNSEDAKYIENKEGANVFFLVQNLDGSGKAINLSLTMKFEVMNPSKSALERDFNVSFLAPGDSFAYYIYRFEWSGLPASTLKLVNCKISYTTPFDEAAKEPFKEINFDNDRKLPAEGNGVEAIILGAGIRKKIVSTAEKIQK